MPDKDLDDGWQVLRFRVREEPPIQLGLILGDFIHNLRSALDNLVCQLAQLSSREGCERTQFPICDSPELFAHELKRDRLAGLRGEHVAAIEGLQPFPGRDTPTQKALVAIRDFDNFDKHRAIHASLAALDPRPESLRGRRERTDSDFFLTIEYVSVGQPLYDGAVVARARGAGSLKPEMKLEMEIPVHIAFGDVGLAAEKLPVVWKEIEGIVESFAPAFA